MVKEYFKNEDNLIKAEGDYLHMMIDNSWVKILRDNVVYEFLLTGATQISEEELDSLMVMSELISNETNSVYMLSKAFTPRNAYSTRCVGTNLDKLF